MTDVSISTGRKPWLAVLLSLVSPALGIVYAGSLWLAVTCFVITIAALMVSYFTLIYGPPWMLQWYLEYVIVIVIGLSSLAVSFRLAQLNRTDYRLRAFNRIPVYIGVALFSLIAGGGVAWMLSPYKTYYVPTVSMENGLLCGERFIADFGGFGELPIGYGDIVVFLYPVDRKTAYVKRCIGVPGDTILITDKQVFINSVPEPLLESIIHVDTAADGTQRIQPGAKKGGSSRDNFGPYVVPDNCIFVLGDNRDNTIDSRFWGPVPANLIIARAVRVLTSPNRSRIGLYL